MGSEESCYSLPVPAKFLDLVSPANFNVSMSSHCVSTAMHLYGGILSVPEAGHQPVMPGDDAVSAHPTPEGWALLSFSSSRKMEFNATEARLSLRKHHFIQRGVTQSGSNLSSTQGRPMAAMTANLLPSLVFWGLL